MPSRIQVFWYSLAVGLALTIAAGWIGLFVIGAGPLLVLLVPFWIAQAAVDHDWGGLVRVLLLPAGFGLVYGSWLVTLVTLPALAQVLRNRPLVLTVVAPLIGTLVGYAVVRFGVGEQVLRWAAGNGPILRAPLSEPQTKTAILMAIAGGFAGFVCGAIFGRTVSNFIRD